MLTLTEIILLLGVFVTCMAMFAMVYRTMQRNQAAYYWLIVFILVWFLSFVLKLVDERGLYQQWPHLSKIHHLLGFMRSISFYLYIDYFLRPDQGFKKSKLLHFLPVLAMLIWLWPYFGLSADQKLLVLSGNAPELNPELPVWYPIFRICYAVAYLIASAWAVFRFYQQGEALQIKYHPSVYQWLGGLLAGYLIFLLASLIPFLWPQMAMADSFSFLLVSILFFIGCTRLLTVPDIQTIQKKSISSQVLLTEEERAAYLTTIKQVIESQKLYLKEGFKLSDLARAAGIPENIVSKTINEGTEGNFLQLVNGYRVEEAKLLLLQSHKQNFTIESIGYEVGFQSRASFYTAFKKITSLTPSEYRSRYMDNQV